MKKENVATKTTLLQSNELLVPADETVICNGSQNDTPSNMDDEYL